MRKYPKLLILTVGYGEGHNSAARAIADAAHQRGWVAECIDPCKESSPKIFGITQKFYHFCVRSAPWVWGITYAQTDTADWASKPYSPVLRKVTSYIADLLQQMKPDAILCTYPLYGYMLDALRAEGRMTAPYGMVVTDALEISRPWMLTQADVIYLPDEYSCELVHDRYAIPLNRLHVAGFPVKSLFDGRCSLSSTPSARELRIVYGAFAPLKRVKEDVMSLISEFRGAHITVLAGERLDDLSSLQCSQVEVIARTNDMASLFEQSHLYIGKAGAATVFEAYSMNLPVIINYALPGQEQGNMALLQLDGAGVAVHTTAELMVAVRDMLADNAAGWLKMKNAMRKVARGGASARIVEDVAKRFFV